MHLTIPNAPCLLNVISGIPVFWVPGPFQMLARTSNFRSTKVLKKEKILFSKFIYSIGIPRFTGPIWCRLFMCFPITHDVRIPQVLNFLFYLYFPNSFTTWYSRIHGAPGIRSVRHSVIVPGIVPYTTL